mgnify:CR=1 FL=1
MRYATIRAEGEKRRLEEVRRNGGVIGGKRTRAAKEPFPFEALKQFQYERDQSITHVLKQIHAPLEGREVKKISARMVTDWMKAAGYLTIAYSGEVGKETTMPTEKGRQLYNKGQVGLMRASPVFLLWRLSFSVSWKLFS